MTCTVVRAQLMADPLDLDFEAEAHVQACAECRRFRDGSVAVDELLSAIDRWHPPTHIGQSIARAAVLPSRLSLGCPVPRLPPSAWLGFAAAIAGVLITALPAPTLASTWIPGVLAVAVAVFQLGRALSARREPS